MRQEAVAGSEWREERHDFQAARIVAGTLTLLAREIREMGPPANLWSPPLSSDFIREVAAQVGRGAAAPLWVEKRHPARGLAILSPSPWDSEFFGFNCARLWGPYLVVEDQRDRESRVRQLARQALERGAAWNLRLITLKVGHDPAALRGFLAENFVLAEIGAALTRPVPDDPSVIGCPAGFQFLESGALPDLANTIVASLGDFFYDGHFRHDPEPGPEAARQLWSRIARDDLTGQADPAVVLWDRKKDRAAGLVTAKMTGREAHLSILAVAAPYQGQGRGGLILGEILNRLRYRADQLRVETASYNLPALRLYQRLGFRPAAPLAALHAHL